MGWQSGYMTKPGLPQAQILSSLIVICPTQSNFIIIVITKPPLQAFYFPYDLPELKARTEHVQGKQKEGRQFVSAQGKDPGFSGL